jgi:arsenate reductase
LELLESKGLVPIVIEYLKTPLNLEQLHSLRTHFSLEDFVRTGEPIFKELGLSLQQENEVLKAMVNAPILMQRPIVTVNDNAIIGRPPERVLDLL